MTICLFDYHINLVTSESSALSVPRLANNIVKVSDKVYHVPLLVSDCYLFLIVHLFVLVGMGLMEE